MTSCGIENLLAAICSSRPFGGGGLRVSERLQQARDYHAATREVLMREWDPIGVSDIPEAADEYDSYIGEVYGLLVGREPLHERVAFLWWVETQHMGLAGNRRKTEAVAVRLQRFPDKLAAPDGEPGAVADPAS